MEERYNLAIDRMKAIIEEKTVAEPYQGVFPACGSVYFKA